MYKVIVAGSRGFDNYSLLETTLGSVLRGRLPSEVEIVSGTARGADKLGERFAKEYRTNLAEFPADWDKHGKSAGYIRNGIMADYADACVVFWDGESRGTQHMVDLATKKGITVHIVRY